MKLLLVRFCLSCIWTNIYLALLDVQQLFGRAHEYANLANRAGIITSDLLLTLNDFGIVPKELYLHAKKQTHHHPSAVITTTPVSDSRNSESENPNKGSATSMSIPRKRRLKCRTYPILQQQRSVPLLNLPILLNRIQILPNQAHIFRLSLFITRSSSVGR